MAVAIPNSTFHNLVISGGASKTISVVGALQYLEECGKLGQINTFVGTSAGAILCFMLALNMNTKEIIFEIREHFLGKDIHVLELEDLLNLNFLESFGIDNGNKLENWLRDLLKRRMNRESITFIEMAKSCGKNLVVCVANLTMHTSEHFSVDSQPNMDVIKALRISSSIPLIYTPVKIKDCLYADGGVYESFPITYFDKHRDQLKDTLAINTVNKLQNKTPETFVEYIADLMSSIYERANKIHSMSDKLHLISIEFDNDVPLGIDFEKMTFPISDDYIENVKKLGYDTIKQHFCR
jgi:predicted acylesterase/phospholipase RssA